MKISYLADKPSWMPSATTARFFMIVSLYCYVSFNFSALIVQELLNATPRDKYGYEFAYYGLVVCTAAVCTIFLTHTFRMRKAFGAFDPLTFQPAVARIERLRLRAGIERISTLVDRDIRHFDAIVFGLPGYPKILIGRGLLLSAVKTPDEFDARIAHELGHIKSGDSTLNQLARAMLFVVLATFVVLIGIHLLDEAIEVIYSWDRSVKAAYGDVSIVILAYLDREATVVRDLFVMLGFNAVFWVLIIILEYKAFLRTREIYADNFSCNLVGSEPVRRVLSTGVNNDLSNRKPMVWRNHPSISNRLFMLTEPRLVGLPSFWLFSWIGFLSVVLIEGWTDTLSQFSENVELKPYREFLSFLMSSDGSTLLFVLFLLIVFLLPFIVSAALLFIRLNLDIIVFRSGYVVRTWRTLTCGFAFGLGMLFGGVLLPSNIDKRIGETSVEFTIDFEARLFVSAGAVALTWCCVSIFSWLPLRFAAFGFRTMPTTVRSWIALCACFTYVFGLLSQIGSMFFSPIAVEKGAELGALGALAVLTFGFWLLANVFGIILGRYWRRWSQSSITEQTATAGASVAV